MRLAKLGKPDKVRLVSRLDERFNERSSGTSFRLNDVNMFPDKPMSCSFADPKVTEVNLLFPADKPSRTVNFETSSVES